MEAKSELKEYDVDGVRVEAATAREAARLQLARKPSWISVEVGFHGYRADAHRTQWRTITFTRKQAGLK